MDIFLPLLGGVIIGISATGLLWSHGRIAGISGIIKGLFSKISFADRMWRISFLTGMVIGGGIFLMIHPTDTALSLSTSYSYPDLLRFGAAGILVGIGTFYANGCTSGHGVCGLGRRSPRSLASVIAFLLAGFISMYLFTHILDLPRL